MRGEIADRVVAPVVAQPALEQERVVDELMDGQELDRGDAERLQMLDRRRMREPGVRSAQLLRDAGMPLS